MKGADGCISVVAGQDKVDVALVIIMVRFWVPCILGAASQGGPTKRSFRQPTIQGLYRMYLYMLMGDCSEVVVRIILIIAWSRGRSIQLKMHLRVELTA